MGDSCQHSPPPPCAVCSLLSWCAACRGTRVRIAGGGRSRTATGTAGVRCRQNGVSSGLREGLARCLCHVHCGRQAVVARQANGGPFQMPCTAAKSTMALLLRWKPGWAPAWMERRGLSTGDCATLARRLLSCSREGAGAERARYRCADASPRAWFARWTRCAAVVVPKTCESVVSAWRPKGPRGMRCACTVPASKG